MSKRGLGLMDTLGWINIRIDEMEEKASVCFDFFTDSGEGDDVLNLFMEDAYYASISDRILDRIHCERKTIYLY